MSLIGLGACHAPHQAPRELIEHYDQVFQHGWDVERSQRLEKQIELGVVPRGTELPPRNDAVEAWAELDDSTQRVAIRLQAAYAAMLCADQQLARLVAHLEASGQLEKYGDHGSFRQWRKSRRWSLGFVNAMGPYNGLPGLWKKS